MRLMMATNHAQLHAPDFTTARNVAFEINRIMGAGTAEAVDAVSVSVMAPVDTAQKVAYLAELENIDISRGSSAAKIIVNARSGTIVIGSEVIVKPAAVATGSLTVTIDESLLSRSPDPSRKVVKRRSFPTQTCRLNRKRPTSSSWKAASTFKILSPRLTRSVHHLATSFRYWKHRNRRRFERSDCCHLRGCYERRYLQ